MADLTHLEALTASLAREQSRFAAAKNENEKALRKVWVSQTEKEIAAEYKFLGIAPLSLEDILSDDDLLAALEA